MKKVIVSVLIVLCLILITTACTEVNACKEHSWGEWQVTKGATCALEGEEERICSVCKEKEARVISKEEHSYGEWFVSQNATCSAEGIEKRNCIACNFEEAREIPKTEHTYGKWNETKADTCKTEGIEERVCSVCGNKETGTTAKINHKFGAWATTVNATCTKEGEKSRSCTMCGTTERKSIAMTDHEYGEWIVDVQATKVSTGNRHRTCIVCGEVENESIPVIEPISCKFSEGSTLFSAAGIFSRQISITVKATGGTGGYTYSYRLYRVGNSEPSATELNTKANKFSFSTKTNDDFLLDVDITDDSGETATFSCMIERAK